VQLDIFENCSHELTILGDSVRIEQALINLLDNANQHSTENKQIYLSIKYSDPDMVSISIRDNGPGIPEDILPDIFKPFFTTRKSGTGLGLSIVKHIVESHNGSINVQNNNDCSGAIFEIRLPLSAIN